jgi:hypothetical protein
MISNSGFKLQLQETGYSPGVIFPPNPYLLLKAYLNNFIIFRFHGLFDKTNSKKDKEVDVNKPHCCHDVNVYTIIK